MLFLYYSTYVRASISFSSFLYARFMLYSIVYCCYIIYIFFL